ncbi:MAG: hypothetical protein QM800_04265 [Paludibacter sp.]
MEKIGLTSAIIALILGIGFLFLANKHDKNEQKSTSKSTNHNKKKNSFGDSVIGLLFFVFLITFYLSTFFVI